MTTLTEFLEKLSTLEKAATPGPLSRDDGVVCPRCSSAVSVRDGCDFEDGDICDTCMQDCGREAINSLPKLLEIIRVQTECLNEISQDANEGGCEGFYGTKAKEAQAKVAEIVKGESK